MSNSMDDINRCAPITLRNWFNLNPNRKNGTYYIGHHFFIFFLSFCLKSIENSWKFQVHWKCLPDIVCTIFKKKNPHLCVFSFWNEKFVFQLPSDESSLYSHYNFLGFFLLYLKKSWKKKNTQRANKRLKYVEYSNDWGNENLGQLWN